MPASTSISELDDRAPARVPGAGAAAHLRAARITWLLLGWLAGLGLGLALLPSFARANDSAGGGAAAKTFQPEEDDFSGSPFTEYGEFNDERDEEEDAKFFQYGRFFGVSIGMGYEGVTGNRGLLYEGGFPMVDFKLHYWFDFNFALDLGFFFASHNFTTTADKGGTIDVKMFHLGLDLKYYIDTKNLSAPISFANPYLVGGFGSFTQTKSSYLASTTFKPDSTVGLSIGAGLEFALRPKKTYLEFEGKYHMVSFADSHETTYSSTNNVPDLTGGFYTFQANVLFTW